MNKRHFLPAVIALALGTLMSASVLAEETPATLAGETEGAPTPPGTQP